MYSYYLIIFYVAYFCILSQSNNFCDGATDENNATMSNSSAFSTMEESADGIIKEICKCTSLHECNIQNIVVFPKSNHTCTDDQICCKIEVTSHSENFNNDTISNSDSDPVLVSTTEESPTTVPSNTDEICVCVLPQKCKKNEYEKHELGPLNLHKTYTCGYEEVCCPMANVIMLPNTNEEEKTIGTSNLRTTNFKARLPRCGERRGKIDIRTLGPEFTKETVFGEFPWMVSILKASIESEESHAPDVFVCGGSILSPNVVLTAAHCLEDLNATSLRIRAGDYNTRLNSTEEPAPHQDRNVSAIIKHPNFLATVLLNDLALLVTSEPFIFDFHVGPICTPMHDINFLAPDLYDTNHCFATGWGKNGSEPDAPYSEVLKKIDLVLIPSDKCEQELRTTKLGPRFILHPSFICAKGSEGYDTCKGDGGGPLVCALKSDPDRYMQIGIVSWGLECGKNISGVYSSVIANSDWLFLQSNSSSINNHTLK